MPLLCYLSILALVACQELSQRPPAAPNRCGTRKFACTKAPMSAAIAAAKRAVERDPNSAVAHRNLADAYARDSKMTEALAAYEQAIRAAT